ncbi:DMT family transporter [Neisseria leonii]|uniref:DMT family transporter n=1 Tax=Neisseria leonii TaxID=2995413 RepID=UPI0030CAC112
MPYLLTASFLWGTSFIAGKIAYEMADPALVVLCRLLIAAAVTLPVSLRFFRRHKPVPFSLLKTVMLLGLLTYPLTFLLQFSGLGMTSAASAATMIGVEPVMVMLVGYLFFREKAPWPVILLGLAAFAGAALVADGGAAEGVSLSGCLLVLASTVLVAFWLRLSQPVLAEMGARAYTALSVQLGTLAGIPLMLLLVENWTWNFSWPGMAALLYLGLGCSLLAAWCWNKGLADTPANISGIFLALEPVFGVLLAVLLLNESLSRTAWTGVVLAVAAAGICILLPKSKTQTA